MAQRLAVLLAVAAILIIACKADEAATYKYEKKGHSKHSEKYDKEYKPEHKEYKPDGYKPDGYKPDGYKPDYHKPGYGGKEYEHYGEHAYPPYGGYDLHKPYAPEYAPSSYGYESYGEATPSPYDGGYWGGSAGRQIIHLQSILREDLLNTTADFQFSRGAPEAPCKPVGGQPNEFCLADLGLYCGLRHPEGYYGSDDYASGSKGPIFKSAPKVPAQVGKAFLGSDIVSAIVGDFSSFSLDPINLVVFNKNQKGYKIGDLNGYINLFPGADNCHPLLGPGTSITYYDEKVPVYLIFGKIEYPVDPAALVPFGGLLFFGLPTRNSGRKAAKIQSATEATEDYKTTKAGTNYALAKDTLYVEKDGSLCGLTLVARGAVKLDAPGDQDYEGTLEWPLVWTDLITTLPLLIGDNDPPSTRQLDAAVEVYLENTLDRIAALCKNNNIPWVTPGLITLDVSPVPSA